MSHPNQNQPQQNNPPNQSPSTVDRLSDLGERAGIFAEILLSISYLLPASLAGPLRSFANTLSRSRQVARRIEQASEKLDKLDDKK